MSCCLSKQLIEEWHHGLFHGAGAEAGEKAVWSDIA